MSAFQSLNNYEAFLERRQQQPSWMLLNVFVNDCPICLKDAAKQNIAAAFDPKSIELVELDRDKKEDLDSKLGIKFIPALLLFHYGEPSGRYPKKPDDDGANVITWLKEQLSNQKGPPPASAP